MLFQPAVATHLPRQHLLLPPVIFQCVLTMSTSVARCLAGVFSPPSVGGRSQALLLRLVHPLLPLLQGATTASVSTWSTSVEWSLVGVIYYPSVVGQSQLLLPPLAHRQPPDHNEKREREGDRGWLATTPKFFAVGWLLCNVYLSTGYSLCTEILRVIENFFFYSVLTYATGHGESLAG